ncbi:MAG TPA: glycosyltransferase family 2 protein [Patescibacteria group bacterium]|nr:glycosyltransferase family 2 protein [Patescibacteria group bacterium]
MMIMFWVFDIAILFELLLLCTPLGWHLRKFLAPLALLLTAFASGGIALWRPSIFSVLFLVIGLYRVFNMVRIVENRMHTLYLRHATRRTGLLLMALQILLVTLWAAWEYWHTSNVHMYWAVFAGMQTWVAFIFLASTLRRLRRTAWSSTLAAMSDSELPTVSVAIPARNETEDLEECLRSIIASDYPKLEVLVLDDCSQTKRTSDIIRNFAHDGVRFIQGEEPGDTWLPKNQAYDRLAKEASGEYILFCGVDVRFDAVSIRELLTLMASKKKEMVSILPWRSESAGVALTQSMRYWWELVPPRRLFQRPPVLSTCWIISRHILEQSGGFAAVARSITPEAFFARHAASHDAYSFMRASVTSGIVSVKATREQRETAVRTRYPQLHRRPENVCIVSLAELLFLVMPFGLAIAGFWFSVGWVAQTLAMIAVVLLTLTYELLTRTTRTGGALFGLIGLPVGILYDICLLHYSMWQYEFSTVDWKGRNICIPAMHVTPHLPRLE